MEDDSVSEDEQLEETNNQFSSGNQRAISSSNSSSNNTHTININDKNNNESNLSNNTLTGIMATNRDQNEIRQRKTVTFKD